PGPRGGRAPRREGGASGSGALTRLLDALHLLHLLAEAEGPHVRPHLLDVRQALLLGAVLPRRLPAQRELPVRGPDGVLLLVVHHHLVLGRILALVAHPVLPSRAFTICEEECIMEGMRMKAPASWVLSLPAPASTRLKLFCFSHAGGGASAFVRWP